MPRRTLLDDARWLMALLDSHPKLDGRKVSRFAQISRALIKSGGDVIKSSDPGFGAALQAYRDLSEMRFIFEMLEPDASDVALWHKIASVFGDHVLPAQSLPTKSARDTQFELLCRAMLHRAGMEPVPQPQHADFSCRIGDMRFFVEAKRAKTMQAVVAEVRTGARQVRDSVGVGFLLIDYSQAVDPERTLITLSGRPVHFGDIQQKRFERFWRDFGERLQKACDGTGVLGLVFVDSILVQEGLSSETTGNWMHYTIRDSVPIAFSHVGAARLRHTFFQSFNEIGLPAPAEKQWRVAGDFDEGRRRD